MIWEVMWEATECGRSPDVRKYMTSVSRGIQFATSN